VIINLVRWMIRATVYRITTVFAVSLLSYNI